MLSYVTPSIETRKLYQKRSPTTDLFPTLNSTASPKPVEEWRTFGRQSIPTTAQERVKLQLLDFFGEAGLKPREQTTFLDSLPLFDKAVSDFGEK